MKVIMVMFDSLRRKALGAYANGFNTPNFDRLAAHAVSFDNSYVCSMPCMPARRELHTGRANFLHRSWGPIEPFDDSMPEILKKSGIRSHLISDHQHYWEDGGATYHSRYSSWELSRGQEGDPWRTDLTCHPKRSSVFDAKKSAPLSRIEYQDELNRSYMEKNGYTAIEHTFSEGIDFIKTNHMADKWFLQIETFEPHEPFFMLNRERCELPSDGKNDDWPPYARVTESDETVSRINQVYSALVKKCDRCLGMVLDLMDEYSLWEDTMLIVNTDHGFLLGEHGWWGKTVMPIYDEIGHTPLFIYDPRYPESVGARRESLVQTIDIAPTILEFFSIPIPQDMRGRPLCGVISRDIPVRDAAVFGYHGSQIDVTDGEYLYMLSPENENDSVFEYTLMPTHMRTLFSPEELKNAVLAEPFSFSKGCPILKIEAKNRMGDTSAFKTTLYNLKADPNCECPLAISSVERRMKYYIRDFLIENDAPCELYERYNLMGDEK